MSFSVRAVTFLTRLPTAVLEDLDYLTIPACAYFFVVGGLAPNAAVILTVFLLYSSPALMDTPQPQTGSRHLHPLLPMFHSSGVDSHLA